MCSSDLIFMLDSIKNEYRKNPSFYMDSLFFNHQFSFSPLLDFCKFVYLIRKPRYIVPDLVEKKIYDYNSACSYYNFRLRKIYEMIIKTPKENQRVYFDDDFEKQDTYEDIKSYLNLKEGFKIKNAIDEPRSINSVFEICDKCYEKYRYKIKQGLR